MSPDVALALAHVLLPDAPIAAAKCLESALAFTLAPMVEAHLRLRLARITLSASALEGDENVTTVLRSLERCVLLLATSTSVEGRMLACEVHATLAECHLRLGNAPASLLALSRGAEASVAARCTLPASHLWTQWLIHFMLRQAAAFAAGGDARFAADAIARASAAAAKDEGFDTSVCDLARAHFSLLTHDCVDVASVTCVTLSSHFVVLRVLASIQAGNYAAAASEASKLTALRGTSLTSHEPPQLMYELPPQAFAAFASLLSVACERSSSGVRALETRARLNDVLHSIDAELSRPAYRTPLLCLKFCCLDQLARSLLGSTQLAAAGKVAAQAVSLVADFPQEVLPLAAAAASLSAAYCSATHELLAAVKHSDDAIRIALSTEGRGSPCNGPAMHRMVAHKALALLAHDAAGSVGAANEVLDAGGYREGEVPAVCEMVEGLLALRRNNRAEEAKRSLTRAIKRAHSELRSHEVVSVSMTGVAAVTLASGDAAQAKDICTSAFTLSKADGDLASQINSLAVLARCHAVLGDEQNRREMEKYASKKRRALDAAIVDARTSPHHQMLL